MFSKNDNRVIVLFHSTRRTLDARLKPGHDAFFMKNVFTLEFLGLALTDLLKTHCTYFGQMCKALPVFHGLLFAFGTRLGHRRTVHFLLGYYKYLRGLFPHFGSRLRYIHDMEHF